MDRRTEAACANLKVAAAVRAANQEKRRLAILEDVVWMLDTGETDAETIAGRLRITQPGITPSVLERKLTRWGENELLRRMTGRMVCKTSRRVAA